MKIKGLTALMKDLDKMAKSAPRVKEAVKKNGAELDRVMKRNATFVKGYQTGETKRSINTQLKDAGYTSVTKPTTEYSGWLETGTRFMNAQPFVAPSLKEQEPKFIKDIEKASRGD